MAAHHVRVARPAAFTRAGARGRGAQRRETTTRHPPPPPRGSTVAGQPAARQASSSSGLRPSLTRLVNTYDDGSSRGPAGSELASGNDQLADRTRANLRARWTTGIQPPPWKICRGRGRSRSAAKPDPPEPLGCISSGNIYIIKYKINKLGLDCFAKRCVLERSITWKLPSD